MKLLPPPDLSTNRRVGVATLAVFLIAGIGLILHGGNVATTLGGPDDAMRLVLVRSLLSGHGWYDQLITRLQPPHGVYLHWSRLLDGVLATLTKFFEIWLSPAAAETAMRFTWPLILMPPAILCALLIARRIGGSLAVFICAVLLASNQQAFAQFIPGRIDHHNIQILLVLVATACAMAAQDRSRWALLAGASSALGLAIGIEGLPFHALIGMSYALQATTGHDEGRTTRNYGFSLLAAILTFYCLQTPPSRWAMSFCDAIGLNLIAAVAVACCGMIILTFIPKTVSTRGRSLFLASTLLMAAAAYLAFDPACVRGPIAAVDPRIRAIWFNSVAEMQSIPVIMERHWGLGVGLTVMSGLLLAAIAYMLANAWPRIQPPVLLATAIGLLATVIGFCAFRMESYAYWLGFPLLAVGLGAIATRFLGGLMTPTVILSVLLSPVGVETSALVGAAAIGSPKNKPSPSIISDCNKIPVYRQLAALPPGLVLSDVTLGSYVLANTQDTVLSAPYHRMAWGILAAHDALSAPAAKAKSLFHHLKINYLVTCSTRAGLPAAGSIEADLLHGLIPDWLTPLSSKGQTIQVYRVRAARSSDELEAD